MAWGPLFSDFEEFLKQVSQIGFRGVELVQAPDIIKSWNSIYDIPKLLGKYDLIMAGLSGGSLTKRRALLQAFPPVEYLCSDEWDSEIPSEFANSHVRIGLHPHRFKDMESISHAEIHLAKNLDMPNLGVILDTAHQYLVSQDADSLISRLTVLNDQNRLVAIHLKDWSDQFGLSPLRFPDGFVALGQGVMTDYLDRVISWIREVEYGGWIIVEQDSAHGDPMESACASYDFLTSREIVQRVP